MKALSIIGIVLSAVGVIFTALLMDINYVMDRVPGVILAIIIILLYLLALSITACVKAFSKKK